MVPPRPIRRALLPLLLGLQLALAALAVVAAAVGVITAAADRRMRILRIAVVVVAYVGVEWCALGALFRVWLLQPIRDRSWADQEHQRVLRWALGRLLGVAGPVLGFTIEVSDPADRRPLSEPAPVLALARHGGIGDSIAVVWLLLERYGRRPRVALKDVLAWDPVVDVVLGRLGACFLPPLSRRGATRSRLIGALAAGLEARDALLLFPEGKNWTPGRWVTAIRRLRAEHGIVHARRAALMGHVLPPRWGGVSACLDARPDLPVVVFAHTGLDKITSVRQLWHALPFRSAMAVRWWATPAAPEAPSERVEWLITEWAVVDEWIDAYQSRTV